MRQVASIVIVGSNNKHTATIRCVNPKEDKIFSSSNKETLYSVVEKYVKNEPRKDSI
jgi:hypothetical protein